MSYVIVTDSTTDLTAKFVEENNIVVIPMHFQLDDVEYVNYLDGRELSPSDFYAAMRSGSMTKTSQLTIPDIEQTYRKILSEGNDILGIGFSSALSGTFNAMRLATEELREEFPDRKINIIDSKCASLGEGLFVFYANEYKKQGLSLDETTQKLIDLLPHLVHWFTVDDIETLRRGGRVTNVQAFLAKLTKIKPVLHVDNEGRLIPVYKKIGRRQALKQLVDELAKSIDRSYKQTIMIGHGDCYEDAEYVATKVKEVADVKEVVINNIGPVIGAHSGPGTVALFFVGKER